MYYGSTWRRRGFLVLLFSLCLSAVLFATKASSTQTDVSQSPPPATSTEVAPLALTENVRKTVLDNGLVVLTKEVHTAPVVSVQVWYRIGSRNEAQGVNGIAHQLEHMLFKGTKDRPIQFGRLFSALGSDSNAFTSYDNTAYFGTVEREKLSALLALEADRMQNSNIEAQQLESEKNVVISELQGYENSPSYRLSRAVMRAAFPNQAYGLPVGGTKADVEKFTVEQVQDYYRRFYSPDNATLVIVGDFETELTLSQVKETFGKVPKISNSSQEISNNQPTINNQQPTINNRIVLREEGSAALLEQVYPLPAINHPDVPAIDVMDYILTEGRNSRLYQAVVETGLASAFSGYAANLIESGWYELAATAAPGQELSKIEQVFASEIATLQDKGVTEEEVSRAKRQLSADVILGNRDITSQALQLGSDQSTGGDYRFTDRYLAGVQNVTRDDVQRVAQTYLKSEKRTVGFFEPTQLDGQSDMESVGESQTTENFNAGPPVDPVVVAQYLPPIDSSATPSTQALPEVLRLANGLQVLLFPDTSTPTVTLSGSIRGGTEFDSMAKAGLADLTASNLMNGTKTREALTIAKALEERGASLGFGAYREGVDIGGYSLAADLPILIQTFADVVQNATFPTDKLELTRQQTLTSLAVELDTPAQLGRRTFQQAIYPENHPYHAFPTADSLKSITRDDVVRFYQTHYRPDTTVLALVGDFNPASVRSLLETQLSGWKVGGKPPVANYPKVELPQKIVQLNPVLPGKVQSVTYLGYRGIDRKDPRYYAALVLNQILGGDTLSSRLGTEIRDRQGLTYGIYSYFQAGMNPGPFLIQMQTAPEDAQKAIASTISLLKEIQQKGLTSAEVNTAKRSITSQYPVALANPDELAETILRNQVYGLAPEELREFVNRIEAVTLEQVNQTAKELLRPDNLIVVTAGPAVSAAR
ncbi:insulinase family protein [Microcoleus sp. FACHB-SPT15]|uniref:M16 family metallopeptidase n=1 Tax=Microcoleus sp. FACHB-SPT15 TaxID=2692830 RepID=UPI001780FE76|nr:pitrilysin family protein [Microcoleus sp. FACHB-SPT15]MBD1805883.1 insulinase family protein [Microcoleus sp. FACHB-SPT15]